MVLTKVHNSSETFHNVLLVIKTMIINSVIKNMLPILGPLDSYVTTINIGYTVRKSCLIKYFPHMCMYACTACVDTDTIVTAVRT